VNSFTTPKRQSCCHGAPQNFCSQLSITKSLLRATTLSRFQETLNSLTPKSRPSAKGKQLKSYFETAPTPFWPIRRCIEGPQNRGHLVSNLGAGNALQAGEDAGLQVPTANSRGKIAKLTGGAPTHPSLMPGAHPSTSRQ
jgi:hypothetical protein